MSPQPLIQPEAASDACYYRGVLHELIDMGTDVARGIHRQAMAPAEPASNAAAAAPDLTVAFDRIARCVRRSIMLAQAVTAPAISGAQQRIAARKRVIRGVEDAIQRQGGEAEQGALHAELLDRLDAPDLDDDILSRPIAEIITDICRDLGIAAPPGVHPWQRRTPEDVAILHARAAAPCAAPPCAAPTGATATATDTEAQGGVKPWLAPTRFRGK